MRLLAFRARILISAWVALILLWPMQAAAMGIGRQMTLACRMMPVLHVGGGHGMGACHSLQCHHRLGPRGVSTHGAPPILASVVAVSSPSESALKSGFRAFSGIIRGPPLYLRLSRLLI